MKIIVFSDVHGNKVVLEKLFTATSNMNIDKYFHCGDIFGYFYSQKEVIKLFLQHNVISLMGNHDHYFIDLFDKKIELSTLEAYGNSYSKNILSMDKDSIKYIRDLPISYELNYNSKKIMFYHGSPYNPLEGRIYPDKIEELKNYVESDVLFLGHTHYKMRGKLKATEILNPGSIGLPRDSKGFGYIYGDLLKWEFSFENLEINIEEILDQINDDDSIKEKIKFILKR
jgi:putative phosphoesterase